MTDLLRELDDKHRLLCLATSTKKETIYSKAAAEIRRLMGLVAASAKGTKT